MLHQTKLLLNVLSSSHWSRRHMFLTQIYRNNYYRIAIRSLKPRHKNGLSTIKKSLMIIIYRQCNDATRTKIALRTTYEVDRQDRNITKFLKQVRTVCFGNIKDGLSFRPYKQAIAVKLMKNYSNNKLHDLHDFKVEVKIKYYAVKAMGEKFPNGTGSMIECLGPEIPALDWVTYCAMPPVDQLVWEERGDDLTKSMLFLMNSKNDNTKKKLRLTYYQENITAYPTTIKEMTRYMSTQYPNKNSAHQHEGKRGIETKRRGMIRNLKTKTTISQTL